MSIPNIAHCCTQGVSVPSLPDKLRTHLCYLPTKPSRVRYESVHPITSPIPSLSQSNTALSPPTPPIPHPARSPRICGIIGRSWFSIVLPTASSITFTLRTRMRLEFDLEWFGKRFFWSPIGGLQNLQFLITALDVDTFDMEGERSDPNRREAQPLTLDDHHGG
jgi:hypothetical protein